MHVPVASRSPAWVPAEPLRLICSITPISTQGHASTAIVAESCCLLMLPRADVVMLDAEPLSDP